MPITDDDADKWFQKAVVEHIFTLYYHEKEMFPFMSLNTGAEFYPESIYDLPNDAFDHIMSEMSLEGAFVFSRSNRRALHMWNARFFYYVSKQRAVRSTTANRRGTSSL